MRILLISWEYPPVIEGGLARHVRKLAEHLVGEGIEMHVLTRGGHLPAEEDRHGVVVHRVAEPPFPKDVSAFVRWVEEMNDDMYSLGAELCERIGLVAEVVDDERLLDRALEAAEQIAALSPWGVRLTKQGMWSALEIASEQAAVEYEDRQQIMATHGSAPREAIAAFLEKRPAQFAD